MKANCSTLAPGSRSASIAARQSLGTTSKPTAGISATPAALARSLALGRRLDHVDLAGDVQIVGAGRQAGVHHLPGRLRKRAGAVQHGREAPQVLGDLRGVVEREARRPGSSSSSASAATAS